MGKVSAGVFAVHNNVFKIGTSGRESTPEQKKVIKNLDTFSLSFDNGVEEWNAMDQEGWISRLMTGKGITISFTGKRTIGDEGNDYVAGLTFLNEQAVNSVLDWEFPDGTIVSIPCVVNVTNNGGGDTTNVAPLEFDIMSDGKPTVTNGAV